MGLKKGLKKALTRTVYRRQRGGKIETLQLAPSERLVYGIYFAIIALVCLTILEATYMLVLRSWSSEIFAAITLVVGTILGAFFGQKA